MLLRKLLESLKTALTCNPPQIEPLPYKAPTTKHIFLKNYELGKRKTVFIGEEIIKVKDYNVIKRNINKAEVLNDFTITAPFVSCSGWLKLEFWV